MQMSEIISSQHKSAYIHFESLKQSHVTVHHMIEENMSETFQFFKIFLDGMLMLDLIVSLS